MRKVKALMGMQYPAELEMRDRLRKGGHVIPLPDRAPFIYVDSGDFFEPPDDLWEIMVEHQMIEEVSNGN